MGHSPSTHTIKFQKRELTIITRDEADLSVTEEIFKDHDYQLIDQVITKAKNPIIDVGGHIGLFSLYTSILNPNVPIYSFEPEPDNFQTLKQNLKINKVKNVTAKCLAVSSQDGEAVLHLAPDSHNHSLLEINSPSISIQTKSFERILEPFQRASLAKIDCEGAEFDIFENTPTAALKKVHTYYIEYHQYQPQLQHQKLTQRLQSLGYKTQTFPSRYDKKMGFILATRQSL